MNEVIEGIISGTNDSLQDADAELEEFTNLCKDIYSKTIKGITMEQLDHLLDDMKEWLTEHELNLEDYVLEHLLENISRLNKINK